MTNSLYKASALVMTLVKSVTLSPLMETEFPLMNSLASLLLEAALMKINFIESFVEDILNQTKDMKLDITEC